MEDSAEDRVRCYKHITAECESEKGKWLRGPEFGGRDSYGQTHHFVAKWGVRLLFSQTNMAVAVCEPRPFPCCSSQGPYTAQRFARK